MFAGYYNAAGLSVDLLQIPSAPSMSSQNNSKNLIALPQLPDVASFSGPLSCNPLNGEMAVIPFSFSSRHLPRKIPG